MRQGLLDITIGKFLSNNYGTDGNLLRYKNKNPLDYENFYRYINIPIHFMSGRNDPLVPREDVLYQYSLLKSFHPELPSYSEYEGAGHLAFTIGQNSEVITELLRQLNSVINECPESTKPLEGVNYGYTKMSGDLKLYNEDIIKKTREFKLRKLNDYIYNAYYLYA